MLSPQMLKIFSALLALTAASASEGGNTYAQIQCTYERNGRLNVASGYVSTWTADGLQVMDGTGIDCDAVAAQLNKINGINNAIACDVLTDYSEIDNYVIVKTNSFYVPAGFRECDAVAARLNEILGEGVDEGGYTEGIECNGNAFSGFRACVGVAERLNNIITVIETDCNRFGTISPEYSCECNAGYAGNTCQYSNAVDCSGAGTVDKHGDCTCKPGIQGLACDSEEAADNEAVEFEPFYISAAVVSTVTFSCSYCYAYDTISDFVTFLKVLVFAAFVTLRIFDTMSDWAMCLISLKSERFTLKSTYGSETGLNNYDILQKVALAFTIIGTLLLALDLATLRRRAAAWLSKYDDELDDEERQAIGRGMGAIVVLEDAPQLAIAVVYLKSVTGFTDVNKDDTLVMLSFTLSILSLLANGWTSLKFQQ